MIKTVTIREGQSLFDLALQLYGDVTKVVELCKLNPDVIPSVITPNITGLTIQYEEQNNNVTSVFAKDNTIITSRYPETITGKGFSNGFSKGFK